MSNKKSLGLMDVQSMLADVQRAWERAYEQSSSILNAIEIMELEINADTELGKEFKCFLLNWTGRIKAAGKAIKGEWIWIGIGERLPLAQAFEFLRQSLAHLQGTLSRLEHRSKGQRQAEPRDHRPIAQSGDIRRVK